MFLDFLEIWIFIFWFEKLENIVERISNVELFEFFGLGLYMRILCIFCYYFGSILVNYRFDLSFKIIW